MKLKERVYSTLDEQFYVVENITKDHHAFEELHKAVEVVPFQGYNLLRRKDNNKLYWYEENKKPPTFRAVGADRSTREPFYTGEYEWEYAFCDGDIILYGGCLYEVFKVGSQFRFGSWMTNTGATYIKTFEDAKIIQRTCPNGDVVL